MTDWANLTMRSAIDDYLKTERELHPSSAVVNAMLALADIIDGDDPVGRLIAGDALHACTNAIDELNLPLPSDEIAAARRRRDEADPGTPRK